jgi:hypothetical protein
MKIFFRVLLLFSVVFPFYAVREGMGVFGQNQWRTRPITRANAVDEPKTHAHFGITGAQLAKMDEFVATAYNKAVDDGYKLGTGYSRLWGVCIGLDVLLFIASLLGLRHCRCSDRQTNRS